MAELEVEDIDRSDRNLPAGGAEMPKSGKKGSKRITSVCTSDVTLNDFADCARPQSCIRVKKSLSKPTSGGGKNVPTSSHELQKEEDDLDWFEKDLEDFDINDASNGEEEPEPVEVKSSKGLKAKQKQASEKIGLSYPLDLWFQLSSFIEPEDVSRFAGICQATHSLVESTWFWRKLYSKHCCQKEGTKQRLPDDLKPSGIEKLHGLRARVIRSFFFRHDPLAIRCQGKGPMDDDPHILKGCRCLLAWHQPGAKGWQFCFKFQKPRFHSISVRKASKKDLYHGYDNIFYNPEEGCCVLQVTCCHFASVASVMGLLLKQVHVSLSHGFCHHRLRLYFDSTFGAGTASAADTVVLLDDVFALKIMNWWHPAYPFTI